MIYDLERNSAGENGNRLTSFTEIFYHDWRLTSSPNGQLIQEKFDHRYRDFQIVIPNPAPGKKVVPMMVDVMFEVVNIVDG